MEAYQNYNSVIVNLEPGLADNTMVTNTATYEQAFLGENFSDAKGKKHGDRKSRRAKIKAVRQDARKQKQSARKSKRQMISDIKHGRQKPNSEEEAEKGSLEEDTQTKDADMSSNETQTSNQDETNNEDQDNSTTNTDNDNENQNSEDNEDQDNSGDEVYSEDEDSNFVSEISGDTATPKQVKVMCYQIEMTNEALSNLMQMKALKQQKGGATNQIDKALQMNFQKANDLEKQLEQFSGANGVSSRTINKEKRKARLQRLLNAPIPPIIMAKMLKQGWDKSKIQKWWEQRGRNSMLKSFSFDGTSDEFGSTNQITDFYNADDLGVPVFDYEQPEPQMINLDYTETSSNFSGSNDTFWRNFLIGGLIAFAGIYAIRKYKLLS